jgi:excinuclease ABC subunit B
MNEAIAETNRRREKQVAYNKENGITPQSIIKGVDMELAKIVEADYVSIPLDSGEIDAAVATARTESEVAELIGKLEAQMRDAAKKFEFEKAAQLRDRIRAIKNQDLAGLFGHEPTAQQTPAD